MTALYRRIERLRARRQDPSERIASSGQLGGIAEAHRDVVFAAYHYIVESMAPVGAAHTAGSYASAERVQQILTKADVPATFELQGSVTNDTHIRVHSDIDLLVLTDAFRTVQAPIEPTRRYLGDPIGTLLRLRQACEYALTRGLGPEAVNTNGAKAVAVERVYMPCKVDVVVSNWYETDTSLGAYSGPPGQPFRRHLASRSDDLASGSQSERSDEVFSSCRSEATHGWSTLVTSPSSFRRHPVLSSS